MTLSKNIRYLRTKKGWGQDYLAELLGYKSYTTVQKWESGISDPPLKTLDRLAKIFNVDIDDLNNADRTFEGNKKEPKGVAIPIVSSIVAGMPVDAYEDPMGYEEISRELAATGDFVCLKVKGDSMSPVIQEGDLVIVRQQKDVDSGDIAVVRINGDEATLKEVRKTKEGIMLIGYNQSVYPPHFYSNEEVKKLPIEVDGKVVEMKRMF